MKKLSKEEIFEYIHRKFYIQGFNSTPFHLGAAVPNAFHLDILGENYKGFIMDFREDYGRLGYLVDDLKRLGNLIVNKVKEDKNFIEKSMERHEKDFILPNQLYKKLDEIGELSELSSEKLMEYIKKAIIGIDLSVGQGHIIESFALTTDTKIKDMLENHVKGRKELNEYLSILLTPTEKSFVSGSDEELYRISLIKEKTEREKEIKAYLKKFFWIRNTYAGKCHITVKHINEELKDIEKPKIIDSDKIKSKKKEVIEKLKLSDESVMLIEALDLVTKWQDDRKKKILIAVDYADRLLAELGKRINIDVKLMRYLCYTEVNMDLFKKSDLKNILKKRRQGCVYCTNPKGTGFLIGKDYDKFHKKINELEEDFTEAEDLHGMAASSGTAIGKARICKRVDEIKKFKYGEILVSSMTRPEYVTAMKKAAAIITDEGGITCHAAIIARELGIPCIIGTKVATKVIKDGDLLEVKGNHGVVKIIKG